MSFSINTKIGFASIETPSVKLDVKAVYAAHGIEIANKLLYEAGLYLTHQGQSGEERSVTRQAIEASLGLTTEEELGGFYNKLDAVRADYIANLQKLPRYTEVWLIAAGAVIYKFTHS